MRDNGVMTSPTPQPEATDDQTAEDALAASDPADAPDIADGIAAGLQRELDQTATPRDDPRESGS